MFVTAREILLSDPTERRITCTFWGMLCSCKEARSPGPVSEFKSPNSNIRSGWGEFRGEKYTTLSGWFEVGSTCSLLLSNSLPCKV